VLDGKLFVMGGRRYNAAQDAFETLDITIVYDPATDRGGRGQCAGQQPAVCTIDESQRASRRDGHLSVRRGVTPYQVTYSAPVPIPEQRSVDSSYMPATGTGVGRSVVVPSPSWPVSFFPQQYARSAVVTAQAPQISADTSRNGSPPATFTGSTL
jgi:hypothetical protein